MRVFRGFFLCVPSAFLLPNYRHFGIVPPSRHRVPIFDKNTTLFLLFLTGIYYSFPSLLIAFFLCSCIRLWNGVKIGIGFAFLFGFRRSGNETGAFRTGNNRIRAGVDKVGVINTAFAAFLFWRKLFVFFRPIKSLPVSRIVFPETGKTLLHATR